MSRHQPIALRNGVAVVEGVTRDGSPYYLVDDVANKTTHLSHKMAAFILGKQQAWHQLSESDVQAIRQFLSDRHLLKDSELPVTKLPWHQRLITITLPFKLKPDQWLRDSINLWSWLFSQWAVYGVLVLAVLVVWLMAGQYQQLVGYFGHYSTNQAWIVTALVLAKAGHELGHAMAIIKYKGAVKSINLVLLGGMPLPKTDAMRQHRTSDPDKLIIAGAGIYLELMIGLLCLLLWLAVDDGGLRVALHFVVMVSLPATVLFNLIPLMKFDGYYVLSSLTKNPRLYEDAVQQCRGFIYQYALGVKPPPMQLYAPGRWQMVVYGLGILVWRIVLPIGIATAIAHLFDNRFFVVISCLPFIGMWCVPVMNEIKMMKNTDKNNQKTTAMRFSNGLFWVAMVTFVYWAALPIKHAEKAQGAIINEQITIRSSVTGKVLYRAMNGLVEAEQTLTLIIPNDAEQARAQAVVDSQRAMNGALNQDASLIEAQAEHNNMAYATAKADDLNQQGRVIAHEQGEWERSNDKLLVNAGDTLGTLILKSAKCVAFIPISQNLPETIKVQAVTHYGRIMPVTLKKTGRVLKPELFSDYIDLEQGSYQQYTSDELTNITGQSVNIVYGREYSILSELWDRFRQRVG